MSDSEESSNSTLSSGSLAEQAVMGAATVVAPGLMSSKSAVSEGLRRSNEGLVNATTREDTSESSSSEDTISRGDWVALVGQDADGGLQAWLARVVSTNHPDNLISLAYFPRVRAGARMGQHERVWTPEWLEPRDCMSVLPPQSVEHIGDRFYKCSVDLSLFLTGVVSQDKLHAAEAAAEARPKPKRKQQKSNDNRTGQQKSASSSGSGSNRLTSRQTVMVTANSSRSDRGGAGGASAFVETDSDSDGVGGECVSTRLMKRTLRWPDTGSATDHPLTSNGSSIHGDASTAAVVGGVLRDAGVSEFAVAGGGGSVSWSTAHRQRQRKGAGGNMTSVSILGGVTNTFDGGAVGGSSAAIRRLMLQLKETACHPEAYHNCLVGYAPFEAAGSYMLSRHLQCSATPYTAAFRVVTSAGAGCLPALGGAGGQQGLLAAGDSSSDDDDWGVGTTADDSMHGSPGLVRSSIAQGGARGVCPVNGDGAAYLPGGAAWSAVQRASAKRTAELVTQGTDKMLRAEQGVPLNVPPPNVPPPPPYQLDVPGGSDKWPLMGVYRDLTANHARWGAEISLNGARYDLGVYACPAEAAAAYDNARLKAEGPVSSTNLGAARLVEGSVPSVFFGAQWAPQEAGFLRAVHSCLGRMSQHAAAAAAAADHQNEASCGLPALPVQELVEMPGVPGRAGADEASVSQNSVDGLPAGHSSDADTPKSNVTGSVSRRKRPRRSSERMSGGQSPDSTTSSEHGAVDTKSKSPTAGSASKRARRNTHRRPVSALG